MIIKLTAMLLPVCTFVTFLAPFVMAARPSLSLGKVNFEPPIEFKISFLAEGEKGNLTAKRNFLKNLGSNFILKDRSLLFKRGYVYDLVAKITPTKNWLRLCDEIRTYFNGNA